MNIMALKLPPPLALLLCLFFAEIAPITLPLISAIHVALAYFFVAISLLIDAFSLYAFWKARTTITPLQPNKTTALVQTGIFRYSRNPMYLSLASYLTAHAFWRENATSLLLIVPFTLYLTYFQIIPEERILTEKFGEQYRQYQQKVRRWL